MENIKMLYTIKRLNNRTVELNDEIVSEYCKYDVLRDAPFSIVVRSQYGHVPTESECNERKLSEICNNVLLNELKAMALLPKAIEYIDSHAKEIEDAAEQGILVEHQL